MTEASPLLEAHGVSRAFDIRKGPLRRVVRSFNAVEDVSFTLNRGQTLGIVGESGCGKSTLAKMLVTALPPTGGQIVLHGAGEPVDLAGLDRDGLRTVRRRIQMVFQDPFSSLNPRMTAAQIVGEPMRINFGTTGRALRAEVGELLELVGLNPRLMDRYPHAFSGGQRQRIGLARALALKPEIIVADEPVSALDVSVQAQILNLIERLKAELGVTFIFISHDLGVVQHLCDAVLVMYSGRVVERGPIDKVFGHPGHPYVETLMQAAPTLIPGTLAEQIKGEVADPANRPTGCAFHPRCRHAEDICTRTRPPETAVEDGTATEGHAAACHFAGGLPLRGVPMEA
jgi:peptide/nickel transport system ATP-binding protein